LAENNRRIRLLAENTGGQAGMTAMTGPYYKKMTADMKMELSL